MRVVTFGEVMLRLAPAGWGRLRQSIPGQLLGTFGGGELNVAVSIALQGDHAAFLTVVPDNTISDCLQQELGKLGVAGDLVQRSAHGRFGIYLVETGANQRGGTVTYDRSGSSISLQPAADYDWDTAFRDANWLHLTGITPAISQPAAESTLEAARQAKAAGLTISCDLNFRKKLWRWDPSQDAVALARQTMRALMPYVDVVIGNEEDSALSLGIEAGSSDVESGQLDLPGYAEVARRIVGEFDNVKWVAITLRESISASHNNWGGMLYDAAHDATHWAPTQEDGAYAPYEIRNIVDRVGAGDSFAGALIVALRSDELASPAVAIQYAVAASCLKHSITGDFNYATRPEVEALMQGSGSGRVQR